MMAQCEEAEHKGSARPMRGAQCEAERASSMRRGAGAVRVVPFARSSDQVPRSKRRAARQMATNTTAPALNNRGSSDSTKARQRCAEKLFSRWHQCGEGRFETIDAVPEDVACDQRTWEHFGAWCADKYTYTEKGTEKHLGADTITGYMSTLIHKKRREFESGYGSERSRKFFEEFKAGGSGNDTRRWYFAIAGDITIRSFDKLVVGDDDTSKGAKELTPQHLQEVCDAYARIGTPEVRGGGVAGGVGVGGTSWPSCPVRRPSHTTVIATVPYTRHTRCCHNLQAAERRNAITLVWHGVGRSKE